MAASKTRYFAAMTLSGMLAELASAKRYYARAHCLVSYSLLTCADARSL